MYFFGTSSSNPLWSVNLGDLPRHISISSNGYHIAASTNDDIFLYNRLKTKLWQFPLDPGLDWGFVSISADGQYIAVGTDVYKKVYLFNDSASATKSPEWNFIIKERVWDIAISSDGEYIAAACGTSIGQPVGYVYLLNRSTGEQIWNYTSTKIMSSIALSSDGYYIVAGCWDGYVYLFNNTMADPKTYEWRHYMGNPVADVDIVANGDEIVAGCENGRIRLFNNTDPTPQWTTDDFQFLTEVAISAEKNLIVASGQDTEGNALFVEYSTASNEYIFLRGIPSGLGEGIEICDDGSYFVGGTIAGMVYLYYNTFNSIGPLIGGGDDSGDDGSSSEETSDLTLIIIIIGVCSGIGVSTLIVLFKKGVIGTSKLTKDR